MRFQNRTAVTAGTLNTILNRVIEDVIVITNLATQDTPIYHYHWSSLRDKK